MIPGHPTGRSRGKRDKLVTQHCNWLRCMKCGGTKISVSRSRKREERGIEITLQYVECSECGNHWKREIS